MRELSDLSIKGARYDASYRDSQTALDAGALEVYVDAKDVALLIAHRDMKIMLLKREIKKMEDEIKKIHSRNEVDNNDD